MNSKQRSQTRNCFAELKHSSKSYFSWSRELKCGWFFVSSIFSIVNNNLTWQIVLAECVKLFIIFSQATSKQYNEIVIQSIKLIFGNLTLFSTPGSNACKFKVLQEPYPRTISNWIIHRELQVLATATIDSKTSPYYQSKECFKQQLQGFFCD